MITRLLKVKDILRKNKLNAILVSSISNITYLTNFSHFSQHEREAFLFITQNQNYILTDGRYSEAVKNKVKNFKLIEISSKVTLEDALKDLAKKHSPRFGEAGKIRRIGLDHYNITVAEHKKLTGIFKTIKHFDINHLRLTKNKEEILAIENACALGDKTFKYILNKIKLGVSEKQLAYEIEFFIKKAGADISFPPIVAFGANSAIPHHKPSNQQLATRSQFVLLDFGVKLNNYCSDMTRTVFFGKATNEQKRMYQTVLEAQKRAIEFLANKDTPSLRSILAKSIDKAARDYITSQGYPTIPHSLGHGIGLEVHESPRLSPKSKDILKPGMVFTIEPGIYIPGFGGVRIEDVVVIEKTGFRLLTNSPNEMIEI